MDPNATVKRWLTALADRDAEELRAASDDLCDWLDKDGFWPTVPPNAEVFASFRPPLFDCADVPTCEELAALKLKTTQWASVRCQRTGEIRVPAPGEWYVRGSSGYRAADRFPDKPHPIATLVRVRTVTEVHTS